MASGPITLWQIDGGKSGKSDRFYFVGLQTHCGWWLQPRNEKTLALWKKSYDEPSSILKNRDITLPTKVRIVKAVVFPVVMYRCESWIIKRAGHWRIEAFKLWCWRRPLQVPWTARRSNRSNPKGNKCWCWDWRMLNPLATWCKELTHWKSFWCWERLRAGGEKGDRGWDG